MSPRKLSSIAALVSLVSGVFGVIVPNGFAAVFGISLSDPAMALARLACSSYVGYAALNWLARDVVDPAAWRAIGAGNAIAWGLGAAVTLLAAASGVGNVLVWGLVVLQLAFTVAWAAVAMRVDRLTSALASPSA